jgi:O-antigen ligase
VILFGHANAFASIALAAWFVVAMLLFWKLRPPLAAALTVLGGRMFLPEAVSFPLPVFPDLNKYSIPPVAALIGCLFTARSWLGKTRRRVPAIDRWFLLLLAGHVATFLSNRDMIGNDTERPGLTFYDLLTMVCEDLVLVYLLFVLGRSLFRSARELRTLLTACVGLALIYTPFCLFEMVMGPHSHFHLYGFHQHEIVQTLREGGFRPMVFMSHGIVLARFLLFAVLAGTLLVRARVVPLVSVLAVVYLGIVLLASKSMGALVLAFAALPLVLIASAKTQVRVAAVLAVVVGLYPLLRGADVFPTDTLVGWAQDIHRDRAQSLGSRFAQEDILLEKARERLLFGWGPYGRARVYDEHGKDISVTDGEWIIILGNRGLIGFLAWYALYLVPIFAAGKHLRRIRLPQQRMLIGGFALINALMAIDTLPNAAGSLPHFFWSGALCGTVYGILRHDRLLRLRALWQRRRERAQRAAAAQEAEPLRVAVGFAHAQAASRPQARVPR